MKHQYETHNNCRVDDYCYICDGGIAFCTVCKCAEGSLATDCPGYDCYAEYGDLIYNRKIDFKDGEWIDDIPF